MPKQPADKANKQGDELFADAQADSSGRPHEVGPDDDKWAGTRAAQGWNHTKLYNAVRETLFALPAYFKSSLNITGVLATDLYTFNSALGATIENQIVEALNELRRLWDADNEYLDYRFVRQAQRFPDVILRSAAPGKDADVLMGIELKGWYALAKEREPSFRYTVSPAVTAPWDLLTVYPWALSEVISGQPQVFQPFVTSAHYAAELRNWYWQHGMTSRGDKSINISTVNRFYPAKSDMISDQPASDSGNNFGRLARYGIMEKYMSELREEQLSGIPLDAWQRFLSSFREDRSEDAITREIDRLISDVGHKTTALSTEDVDDIRGHLSAVVQILERSIKA
ncbi:MAG: hypothetical protein MSG64_19255 [Pyrinomonadaceae bacterium MAG19_C2-C3]|nr:hypothetical protein [Pyrinomonadaceae bacterium MAG19_C2-C3]